jgi:hypothetical protein
MPDPLWLSVSEAVKNYAEMMAILVGGGWAFWRFCLRREKETALDIALTHTSIPEKEGCFLAYFDVTLTNKSPVQVVAKRKRLPAFSDAGEVLQYSCSVLLRPVATAASLGSIVQWFADADAKSPLPGDIEADLLGEYEDGGKTDFWMEPSESYHVGVGVVLRSGAYLAMVTFVGQNGDHEFWRRLFIIQIPGQEALPTKERTNVAA